MPTEMLCLILLQGICRLLSLTNFERNNINTNINWTDPLSKLLHIAGMGKICYTDYCTSQGITSYCKGGGQGHYTISYAILYYTIY